MTDHELRTVEIDGEVHRQIRQAKKNPSESENDALRRLLRLPASWSKFGVTLPHGTKLRMQRNDQEHICIIDNGKWLVEGRRMNSPSGAAKLVGRTQDGRTTEWKGWHHWSVKRPGDAEWIPILRLRRLAKK